MSIALLSCLLRKDNRQDCFCCRRFLLHCLPLSPPNSDYDYPQRKPLLPLIARNVPHCHIDPGNRSCIFHLHLPPTGCLACREDRILQTPSSHCLRKDFPLSRPYCMSACRRNRRSTAHRLCLYIYMDVLTLQTLHYCGLTSVRASSQTYRYAD